MVVITVPKKMYDTFARHPIWGVAEVQVGRGYQLLLPPYLGWEERVKAEEAFARLLEEVQAKRQGRRCRRQK
jgi:hypothetical protein